MILALQVSAHFRAEKAFGDRVGGVPAQLRGASRLVHLHEQRASVGAVESTNGTAYFSHFEAEDSSTVPN